MGAEPTGRIWPRADCPVLAAEARKRTLHPIAARMPAFDRLPTFGWLGPGGIALMLAAATKAMLPRKCLRFRFRTRLSFTAFLVSPTKRLMLEGFVTEEKRDKAPKLEWAKPQVRRIRAGSAEDSVGPNVDAVNPS